MTPDALREALRALRQEAVATPSATFEMVL